MQLEGSNWRCLWKAKAHLGEGTLWDARDGCVYWLDVEAPLIRWLHLESGAQHSFVPPASVSALAVREQGGFIASTAKGFAIVDPAAGRFDPLVEPRADPAEARLNDGALDRQGRYWSGSVDNAVAGGNPSGWNEGRRAGLYRLDADGRTAKLDGGFIATNGPLIGLDGRTLYLNDSLARTTFQYDLHDDGSLSEQQIFKVYDDSYGYPDGMTCDAEGGIWIAFFQDRYLRRFDADGSLLSQHELPVRQGTRPVFGGANLDRLFLSSASLSFKDQDWIDQPLAGSLFEIFAHGTRGAAVVMFKG